MARQLPVITIHDTNFWVDLKLMEFRQVDDPANTIPFSKVKADDDHSLVLFDKTTKNASEPTDLPLDPAGNIIPVKLPPLEDLDPDGIGELLHLINTHPISRAIILFRKIAHVHKKNVINHKRQTPSHGNRLRNKQRN